VTWAGCQVFKAKRRGGGLMVLVAGWLAGWRHVECTPVVIA
jgi:hypothetical protein